MVYSIALVRWLRLIALLSLETSGRRFQRSEWPIVVAVLEPIGLVLVLSSFANYMSGGLASPPFGHSFVVFYASGLVPVYLVHQVALKTRNLDQQRLLPFATRFDYLIGCILGDICIKICILAIFLSILGPLPRNPYGCLLPLLILGIMGASLGIIIMVMTSFWATSFYVMVVATRVAMHGSCVYFVMDRAPPKLRDLAIYNPISHAISWFRYELYTGFPIKTLSVSYLLEFTAALAIFAMLLEASTRQWRRVH